MKQRLEDILAYQLSLLEDLKKAKEVITQQNYPDYLIVGQDNCGQLEFCKKIGQMSEREVCTLNYYDIDFTNSFSVGASLRKFWASNTNKIIYISRFEEVMINEASSTFLDILQDLLISRKNATQDSILVISGEKDAVEKIHAINPALYSLFYRSSVKSLKPAQIAELTSNFLILNGANLVPDFSKELTSMLARSSGNGNLRNGAIANSIALDILKRLKPNQNVGSEMVDLKQIRLILASDTQAFDELENLVGLEEIKKTVRLWATNVGLFERRRELGLITPGAGQHMVFKGPAGTAKTTVARIVAKTLAETSVLASGHLVEVDRGDIIADSAEQTARNVSNIVKRALGGVLFIDEAYSLTNNNINNGRVAIDSLLKLMEDYREEFIVIVAGYPTEMETFLSSNPGLRSRFVKVLNFPSYNVSELLLILRHLAKSRGFSIKADVDEALKPRLHLQSQYPGFGNGRHVRNMLDAAIELQGTRLSPESTDEDIVTLQLEDFAENSKYKIKSTGDSTTGDLTI